MIGNKDKGHRSCIQILPNRKESQPMPINEQSSEKNIIQIHSTKLYMMKIVVVGSEQNLCYLKLN